jgi:Ca2+/Na+ antiporter
MVVLKGKQVSVQMPFAYIALFFFFFLFITIFFFASPFSLTTADDLMDKYKHIPHGVAVCAVWVGMFSRREAHVIT